MDISYDSFIGQPTSHEATVQKIFKKLYDQAIYTRAGTKDGTALCEDSGQRVSWQRKVSGLRQDVEKTKEEAYFFRLSISGQAYKYIEEHPDFIQPASRQNEMLIISSSPAEDLCVSRTTFKWGIPVTFDKGHVIYVWIDALSNYISALGYMSDDDSKYKNTGLRMFIW